jgi:hypothetical protein
MSVTTDRPGYVSAQGLARLLDEELAAAYRALRDVAQHAQASGVLVASRRVAEIMARLQRPTESDDGQDQRRL